MPSVVEVAEALEAMFPLELAEEWDNVGLLVGDRNAAVERIMTCLTVTPEVADEASSEGVDLVVSHHPFPFHAERRWTVDTSSGRILATLMRAGVSVYSPHTAHDSALWGVNRQIAAMLGLCDISSLNRPVTHAPIASTGMLEGLSKAAKESLAQELGIAIGSGRIGTLPSAVTLGQLVGQVCEMLKIHSLVHVGSSERIVRKVAIGCGAADDFIPVAAAVGADAMILGETRFHGALQAEQLDLALVMPGHYATERFAMEFLARRLAIIFPGATVWASAREVDPVIHHHQTGA